MSPPEKIRLLQPLTPEAEALLSRAMYPDPERIGQTLGRYRHDPELRVYGLYISYGLLEPGRFGCNPSRRQPQGTQLTQAVPGRLACAAGVRLDGRQGELLHIGTAPELAGRGYGRRLIHELMNQLGLERLQAQTDHQAAGFYRKAGFQVQPTETSWGRRYLCWLNQSTIHPAT
ncbi:GNAT family N-acetyltransferase [Deinococcus sp.]|uniref:GNAT family N-acetyltransferase n=1 Tax=Deinococcus sp. TaxID=47478 RepID=UPI0025BAC682|nr:GNAT family N-acetyltransferase [Deinococcus sp.]